MRRRFLLPSSIGDRRAFMRFTVRFAIMLFAMALSHATAAQPSEEIITRSGVSFVSGGVGVASEQRLNAMEGRFNLKLVFTLTEGNYLADVGVVLKNAAGKNVVEHVAEGPIFLAKLPAGTYSVSTSYNGKTQSRTVKIGERLRTEYFRWPATPEADLPVSRWIERDTEPKTKAGARPTTAAKPKAETPLRGAISFLSGGIGEDAQAELKAKESEYNLKLVFTLTEGNYLADIGVVLKDAAGRTVIEHLAEGPIFLAKLPAGAYSANVSYNGKAQSRKIRVGERLHTEYFRWLSNPETDFPLSREQAEEARPKTKPKRG